MKKILISILFLCIGIAAIHAQEPVVKWGKVISHNFPPSARIMQLFTPTESGVFLPLSDGILIMDENPDIKKYQFGKINF